MALNQEFAGRSVIGGPAAGAPRALRPARTRLRVVIADGDPLARRVLRDLLQDATDITVVAEARDGVEALELVTYYMPDLLLSALELPRLGGLETLARVRAQAPDVRVVFLSVPCPVETEVAALRAGASGFLSKDMPIEAIPDALRRVVSGEARTSPAAAAHLVRQLRALPYAGGGTRPVRSALTSREWEVVDMLGAGIDPRAIAMRLGLAPDTVRTHLKHIMRKLGVRTVPDVIAAADRLCRGTR